MLKRELKVNLRTLIIWSLIFVCLFTLIFAIYPSMVNDKTNIDDLIQTMPKEILQVFNLDVISISKVSGWFLTEGYLFVTLLGSCYFAILGGTIILKEQSEHTIEFLYAKPITKNQILNSKIITGIIYIIAFNAIIGITTLIGLNATNDFNFTHWVLGTIAPIFIHLCFFITSMLISLLFKKTTKSITINVGVVFGTYIIGVIAMMNDKIDFLKYLSPFQYIDSKTIITDNSLSITNLSIISSVIVILFIVLYNKYNNKELGL